MSRYIEAKNFYSTLGIDTEKAINILKNKTETVDF